jgi:hypothetical protein
MRNDELRHMMETPTLIFHTLGRPTIRLAPVAEMGWGSTEVSSGATISQPGGSCHTGSAGPRETSKTSNPLPPPPLSLSAPGAPGSPVCSDKSLQKSEAHAGGATACLLG